MRRMFLLVAAVALGCDRPPLPADPAPGRGDAPAATAPARAVKPAAAEDPTPEPPPAVPPKDAWPSFRGTPLQAGVADADLPDELRELWRFKVEEGFDGAVAVADGVVYAACLDEHVYALNLSDGKQKWKAKVGSTKAPPTVVGKRLLVGDTEGRFHCLDREDGKELWVFETNGEITSGSTPAGDTVLFGSHDQTLYCVNVEDGKEKWKFSTEGPVYGTPAVVGDRTFVAGCDSLLHVIDVKTGREVSSVDLGSQSGSAAAVYGRHLYVGTYGKQVLAIDWRKAEVVWRYEAPKRKNEFVSSPAVTADLVFVGSKDRQLHAIERATGKGKWAFLTDKDVDSSPVVVGGRVYVGSADKFLYVLDAATGAAKQKVKLDGGVAASPAVAADRLVIATDAGTVYCFGK